MPYRPGVRPPQGPAIIALDPRALARETVDALAHKIGARPLFSAPEPRVSFVSWVALASGAALWVGLVLAHTGTVTSEGDWPSWLVAALYGTATGLIARGALGMRGGTSRLPLGTFIFREGIVEVTSGLVRIGPAARMERFEVRAEPPGASGLSLIRLVLVFDDQTEMSSVFFGTEANVPPGLGDALREVQHEARIARSHGDGTALAALSVLPEDRLTGARRSGSTYFAKLIPPVVSLAAALLAHALVLPFVALNAQAPLSWWALSAIDQRYGWPWVRERVSEARRELYDRARDRVATRLSGAAGTNLENAVTWLAARDRHEVLVRVQPAQRDAAESATAWLVAHAPADAVPAPVILDYPSIVSLGSPTGSSQVANTLASTLDLYPIEFVSHDPQGDAALPRLVVEYEPVPMGVLTGDGDRAFASLAFTFRYYFELPGQPRVALGHAVTVPAPESLDVARIDTGVGDRPFDTRGGLIDALSDSMVYVQQLEQAASRSGAALAAQMLDRDATSGTNDT